MAANLVDWPVITAKVVVIMRLMGILAMSGMALPKMEIRPCLVMLDREKTGDLEPPKIPLTGIKLGRP